MGLTIHEILLLPRIMEKERHKTMTKILERRYKGLYNFHLIKCTFLLSKCMNNLSQPLLMLVLFIIRMEGFFLRKTLILIYILYILETTRTFLSFFFHRSTTTLHALRLRSEILSRQFSAVLFPTNF